MKLINFIKINSEQVVAPVSGKCVSITQVNDEVFSSKAMGDGFAIIPKDCMVVSPVNGEVVLIAETKHAFGLKTKKGLEVLVHIGLDTVQLEGKGFNVLKKVNQRVKKGEPVVEVDLDFIKENYDSTTMMIVTNGKNFHKICLHESINIGDVVFEGIDEYEIDKKD